MVIVDLLLKFSVRNVLYRCKLWVHLHSQVIHYESLSSLDLSAYFSDLCIKKKKLMTLEFLNILLHSFE